jgi:predicted outer membrane repeat protein
LTGCKFIANQACEYGGGVYSRAQQKDTFPYVYAVESTFTCKPTFINSAFLHNSANYGGGIFNLAGQPTLTNCNVLLNSAALGGGGIYNGNLMGDEILADASVNNCIVWGNTSPQGGQIESSLAYPAKVTVSHSCIQGGYAGTGNISVDPLFVSIAAEHFRLRPGSPCIDAGDNAAVPSGIASDLAGNLRFIDDAMTVDCQWADGTCGTAPIVDMGAYEYEPLGDYDGDGILNQEDHCPGTIPGATVDADGCTPLIPGDYDRDGDVDDDDVTVFGLCGSGPDVAYASNCGWADFDLDADVDQEDFGVLQRCLSGVNVPGDPACGQ